MNETRESFALARVPASVQVDGESFPVVGAVFVPGRTGELDSHLVIWHDDTHGTFTVHYLVHDDDAQESRLTQGTYGLGYMQARGEMFRRLGLIMAPSAFKD